MTAYIYNKVYRASQPTSVRHSRLSSNLVAICGVVLMSVIIASCAKEPICESSHPHYTGVSFEYDMSNLEGNASQPDSMHVVCNRLVYSKMWNLNFNLVNKSGRFDTSVGTELPDSMKEEDNHDLTVFPLEHGQYKFFTMNTDLATYDFTEVENYFKTGKTSTIGGHYVTYKVFDRNDKDWISPLYDWVDYNSYKHESGEYAGFLNSMDDPLLVDSTDITTLPKDAEILVTFTPKPLSHNVDVYFDIKKDVDSISFVIDSVFCVFSGIPYRIDVGTGALDFSKTNKILTKMKRVSTATVPDKDAAEVADTRTNKVVRCYKNINILGMVENATMADDRYFGPGVMQVILFTTVYDRPQGSRTKVVYGLVNLHNALEKAQLQEYDAYHNITKKARLHTVMPITIDLTIGKTLLYGGDDGGIPDWKEEVLDEGDEFDIY